MKNNYCVICDKDTLNLNIIKDGFKTRSEAEKFISENNLSKDDYFVENIELR
jgi:hypothetical protein